MTKNAVESAVLVIKIFSHELVSQNTFDYSAIYLERVRGVLLARLLLMLFLVLCNVVKIYDSCIIYDLPWCETLQSL